RRKQTTTNAIEQTKPATKQTNKETKTTRDHLTETQKGHYVTKRKKKKQATHKGLKAPVKQKPRKENPNRKPVAKRDKQKEGAPSRRHTHLKRTDCKRHRAARNT
ncbi:unnamed protein product, partial [Ixodes pacificus]